MTLYELRGIEPLESHSVYLISLKCSFLSIDTNIVFPLSVHPTIHLFQGEVYWVRIEWAFEEHLLLS